jgi:hypothetical protein
VENSLPTSTTAAEADFLDFVMWKTWSRPLFMLVLENSL